MPEFVTCLNCMDGRAQLPVINWIQKEHDAGYIDMITEAGMDGFIASQYVLPSGFVNKINISVQKHKSNLIFIVGHHDCGGHPVKKEIHLQHINQAVEKIKNLKPNCTVIGLWLSEDWEIEKLNEK
jgi:carbonic anhydrase